MIAALSLAAPAARADGDRARAREAYDRALAEHRAGRFAEAATDFALADHLAPSPIALRAAIDDAIRADDAALGMDLVERSKRAPLDAALAAKVDAARKKFRARCGSIRVVCPADATCQATIDGRAIEGRDPAWVTVGSHAVALTTTTPAGVFTEQRTVDVATDPVLDVAPETPPVATPMAPAKAPPPSTLPPASPPAPPGASASSAPLALRADAPRTSTPRVLPPWVLWIGAGATAAIGGVTVWSGVDTSQKHDDFAAQDCAAAGSVTCHRLATDGRDAETRTNVLLAGTAVVGVATIVAGVFFTRFGDDRPGTSARGQAAAPGAWKFEF